MQLNRVLEQHIAVFGESGSGKTVMVSSFYGAALEPDFLRESLFDITADDPGQGNRLHKNYLGMRDSAQRPETTRFASTSYSFTVKLRSGGAGGGKGEPFDALKLVWHDYPGDWFEQDVSGPDEADRRASTFRALLGSDVALLLVDGQKLLDNAGEEERYLKSLLGNFRTGLLRLKDQLLVDGKPLVRFPRIWVLALSKADLLPEVDVFAFRDLIIGKAMDDLEELRKVISGMVESPSALAVGEDFLRLSSAKFEPNRIEVSERIGLDLVLPLAAILPFERHVRWAERAERGTAVAKELVNGLAALAEALLGKGKFNAKWRIATKVKRQSVAAVVLTAATLGVDQLKKLNADALARRDYVAAVLTGFRLDLDDAEEKRVLLRSRR